MSIYGLIAALGGGLFGAAIGGLPAFIITGVFAIIGSIVSMVDPTIGGIIVGQVAFGSFFGPHIAFAGGVAAGSYAKKKGYTENGADIAPALAGLNQPDVLIVGAIFGAIGYLFVNLVIANVFGPILPGTDNPGITVFCSGILARLAFGGKLVTGDKVLSQGKALSTTLTIAVGYSLLVGALFCTIAEAAPEALEVVSANYAVLIFGTAALGLVFAEMGVAYFGCHHIVIIAAIAAVNGYAKFGAAGAIVCAIVAGTISAILCDAETNLINSGTDSHIDGPAFAIFIMTFVLNCIF